MRGKRLQSSAAQELSATVFRAYGVWASGHIIRTISYYKIIRVFGFGFVHLCASGLLWEFTLQLRHASNALSRSCRISYFVLALHRQGP